MYNNTNNDNNYKHNDTCNKIKIVTVTVVAASCQNYNITRIKPSVAGNLSRAVPGAAKQSAF